MNLRARPSRLDAIPEIVDAKSIAYRLFGLCREPVEMKLATGVHRHDALADQWNRLQVHPIPARS